MATKTFAEMYSISVPQGHFESRVLADGRAARTWIEEPPKLVTVRVEVDVESIAKTLGARAAKSKGRKSAGLHGMVVVREVF